MSKDSPNNLLKIGLIAGTAFCYLLLLYFTPRINFVETIGLFVILFAGYYFFITNKQLFKLRELIVLAVVFRLIALFSMPALSDDYFRFLWDGEMWIRHVNPFAFTPDMYMNAHSDVYLKYLHSQMNSAEYYTVYPAVLQMVFGLAAKLFPSNIYGGLLVMKGFIFLADCATGYLLYKFCRLKNIDPRRLCWYFLNPLVIIELLGNCHFEALLILFLVGCLYFIEKKETVFAAICWALAICSKLLPLMLAPILFNQLGFKKFFKFGIVALIVCVLLFIPFMDATLLNIQYSVSKFYDLFEFNASFYYLITWVSHWFTTNDISDQVARFLGVVAFSGILILSFFRYKKEEFLKRCLFIFTIYFLMTTMVHPWYITTLVALACLGNYKFPLIFSLLIPLSYYPYSLKIFEENMFIILLEYGILFVFIIYEFATSKNLKKENALLL